MSDELTRYGYAKDGKVYLKGYNGFPDREIGVVRESVEQSLKYFVDRFQLAVNRVNEVKDSVKSYPNKGSFLMKIIHLRTYLENFSGLGDFDSLFKELDVLEDEIGAFVSENRFKNTDAKKALLTELDALRNTEDWAEATEAVKDIKLRWIKTGSAHKEIDSMLNESFDALLDAFFERRKEYFKQQRAMFAERRSQYKRYVDQMRMINRTNPYDALDRVKKIQNDWKAVGRVQKNKYMKLWEQFKKEIDYFYLPDEQKQDYQSKYVPKKKKSGIELKKDLLDDVQKMLDVPVVSITKIKNIQKEWKDLGKFPTDEDKELNLQFRIVCNEIFESYFLHLKAREEVPNFDALSSLEQTKSKIKIIKDSIKEDEYQLNMFNNNFRKFGASGNEESEKMKDFIKERGAFINKIKTKQRILAKLQDYLLRSY